jgi:hypothetical protein
LPKIDIEARCASNETKAPTSDNRQRSLCFIRDSRSNSYGFPCAVRPLLEDDPLDDDEPDDALVPPPDPPLPESRDPDDPAYDPALPLPLSRV